MNASNIRDVEELLSKCDDLLSTESSTVPAVLKLHSEIRRLLGLAKITRVRAEEQKSNVATRDPARSNWSLMEKSQVAETLLKEFPKLSINTLLAAVEACDHDVKSEEGSARLHSCARAYLVESMAERATPR